jgi:hypothetical protein
VPSLHSGPLSTADFDHFVEEGLVDPPEHTNK